MDEVSTPVDAQENDKPTDTEQNASVASEPEVLRNEESDTKADAITEAPVNAEPSSPSPDPVADLLGRLAKGQANLGVNSTPPPQSPAPQEVPTPIAGNSTKSDVQAGPSMEMVNALQRTVESLSNRLSQTEDSIARIDQLEEGLAKAVEETEMVSEEMKDILGTLRISIEGLETRLNQVDTGTSEGEDGNEKIEQLEETIASMKDTIDTLKPMTDDVRKAIDSSTEINKRMDVISGNLQATMGYGIQKAFRCDSCGTGGYVTTQVVCSNCGTESWWGWWPQSEGTVQPKSDMTETANTNLASEVESTLNDAR